MTVLLKDKSLSFATTKELNELRFDLKIVQRLPKLTGLRVMTRKR
jgi:hypothetical protein